MTIWYLVSRTLPFHEITCAVFVVFMLSQGVDVVDGIPAAAPPPPPPPAQVNVQLPSDQTLLMQNLSSLLKSTTMVIESLRTRLDRLEKRQLHCSCHAPHPPPAEEQPPSPPQEEPQAPRSPSPPPFDPNNPHRFLAPSIKQGQTFATLPEFKLAVQDWQVSRGHDDIRIDRSDSFRVIYKCGLKNRTGCPFQVRAHWSKKANICTVGPIVEHDHPGRDPNAPPEEEPEEPPVEESDGDGDGEETSNEGPRKKKRRKPRSGSRRISCSMKWLLRVIPDVLPGLNRDVKPKEVQQAVEERFGCVVTYSQAAKARKQILNAREAGSGALRPRRRRNADGERSGEGDGDGNAGAGGQEGNGQGIMDLQQQQSQQTQPQNQTVQHPQGPLLSQQPQPQSQHLDPRLAQNTMLQQHSGQQQFIHHSSIQPQGSQVRPPGQNGDRMEGIEGTDGRRIVEDMLGMVGRWTQMS
ncbi:hypothetical protein BJ508DRAFT_307422 [Ascobolus immersus RN42]|uniref:Transposase MuDR plant domain-containing protein n=1 Tax=Ascobolus immersus RN42 TaxID=1160509 RepID=A0A3N4I345_ASCIM|nr:hypothetical protein BJ508DRAFT_307422 [Ascobolus immersus RN42]